MVPNLARSRPRNQKFPARMIQPSRIPSKPYLCRANRTGSNRTERALTPCLPGMVQFQTMRFADPSASESGLATNPCKDTKRIRSGLESGGCGARQGRGGSGGGHGRGGGSSSRPCAPPLGGRARSHPT
jgi:hypothetical protein